MRKLCLIAGIGLISGSIMASNWNGVNATGIIDALDGRIKMESGHPFATYSAFKLVTQRALVNPETVTDPAEAQKIKDLRDAFLVLFRDNLNESSPIYGPLKSADATKAEKLKAGIKEKDLDPVVRFGIGTNTLEQLQTVIFGSWLNEIETQIDLTPGPATVQMIDAMNLVETEWERKEREAKNARKSTATKAADWLRRRKAQLKEKIVEVKEVPVDLAAKALRRLYRQYLDNRENSFRYSAGTGYSSSNYLHCMAVDSKDTYMDVHNQDTSIDAIKLHLRFTLTNAMANLIVGRTYKEEMKKMEKSNPEKFWAIAGNLGADFEETLIELENATKQGLLYLGSAFHTLEDCAVTCSDESLAKGLCERGDGHTIYKVINGKPQIIALANGDIYEHRKGNHELVDDTLHASALGNIYDNNGVLRSYTIEGHPIDPVRRTSKLLADFLIKTSETFVKLHKGKVTLYKPNGEYFGQFDQDLLNARAEAVDSIMSAHIDDLFAEKADRMKKEEMIQLIEYFKANPR